MGARVQPTPQAVLAAAWMLLLAGLGLAGCGAIHRAAAGMPPPSVDAEAWAEVQRLRERVPGFRVVPLSVQPGRLALTAADSLTIEHLRGVALDDAPPGLGWSAPPYPRAMADDCPPDARPYVAPGIAPFRLRYFRCEFNYGGWHNFDLQDYALRHGFDLCYPYVRKPAEARRLPPGTQLTWNIGFDYDKWLPKHGVPTGRYDLLAGLDLPRRLVADGAFRRDGANHPTALQAVHVMLDLEHHVLPPAELRRQPWYPGTAAAAERAAFEQRYYDGYAATHCAAVEAARREGWPRVGIYGWAPYGRTWGGLERAQVDPGTDLAWNAFGRRIAGAVDVIHNSVYCFYWSPQNPAYVLANLDQNVRLTHTLTPTKPLRPYFWTLLHGGSGEKRWWTKLPLANEEMRAVTALAFFTGIDGLVLWNWSGTGSHHRPSLGEWKKEKVVTPAGEQEVTRWEGGDLLVGRPFTARDQEGDAEPFRRYDAVHVLGRDEANDTVRFQKIRMDQPGSGLAGVQRVFTLPAGDLLAHLRPPSEPVAGMIEGLALVKPLEYALRHGAVRIDVPAQEQFGKTLPIVRRVRCGHLHVLITYDPRVVYGGTPRPIVLDNFGGVEGRTLVLPADAQTRLFLLLEEI